MRKMIYNVAGYKTTNFDEAESFNRPYTVEFEPFEREEEKESKEHKEKRLINIIKRQKAIRKKAKRV